MNFPEAEQSILDVVKEKVTYLFELCPDIVHGFDHAERVATHAEYIAIKEGKDKYMSVLVAFCHDIGRAVEGYPKKFPQYNSTKTHHELSYDMLRDWFREDHRLGGLTDDQKLELLYAVRYHWNDEANEYASAYILRDADKIDGLGEIGLQRSIDHYPNDEKKYHLDIRLKYEQMYYVKTKTAKKMIKKMNLIQPILDRRATILKDAIRPVEL